MLNPNNVLISFMVILPVTLISAAVAYLRADRMASSNQVSSKGLPAVRKANVFAWLTGGLIAGLLFSLLYLRMADSWHNAPLIYMESAVASFFLLSLLAVIACPMLKKNCAPEYVLLNVIWGLGYGGVLPLLITWIGQP
jgi:hypothetical protein